jgi:predicted transcriptional regulator
MTCTDPSAEGVLRDLPESSQQAYHVLLGHEEPLRTAEIAEETDFDQRTILRAVNRLRECDLIERRSNLSTPHIHRYVISESAESV